MKIPIPDDWNGSDWRCIKIQWPDSAQWLGLLLGWLTQQTRGRLWDESTGDIRAVQETGWDIWELNRLLPACSDQHEPPAEQDEDNIHRTGDWYADALCGALQDECEENLMNGPCAPLKIENGHLFWWSCCEWKDIGAINGAAVDDPDELYPPDDEGNYPEFSACGKAAAIVRFYRALVETAWDSRNSSPLNWYGDIRAALGGRDYSEVPMANAVYMGIYLDVLFDYEDLVPDSLWDTLRCRFPLFLGADQAGIDNATFEALGTVIFNTVPEASRVWLGALFNAVGRYTWSKIAQLGATDTEAECDCPEGEMDPTPEGYAWQHIYDFRVSTSGWTIGEGTIVDEGGLTFVGGGQYYLGTATASRLFGTTNTHIKYARLEYTTPAGFEYTEGVLKLHNEWKLLTSTADSSPISAGGTHTPTYQHAVGYQPGSTNDRIYVTITGYRENPPLAQIHISRLWVAGDGDDPFAA